MAKSDETKKAAGRRRSSGRTSAGTRPTRAAVQTTAGAAGANEPGSRPLQNRVDPFGTIFPSPARGLFMGNRGGRIHDPTTRRLGTQRRWVSKTWICCDTCFKDRAREVWGESYTELFFLDEVTALAAGHRPCFECRREAAQEFAEAFGRGNGFTAAPAAPVIDKILHAERLDEDSDHGRDKKLYVAFIDTLPDGAVIAYDGPDRQAYAIRGGFVLPWSPDGWGRPMPRPRRQLVTLVTPPSIVMALKAGYRPRWHQSACTAAFEAGTNGVVAA